jgi:hypothetical protein
MSTAGPDAFPGETLDNVLSRIAATTRAETNAGMAAIEWTDDEIKLAVGRHAAAENDLVHSFLFLVPSILTPAWDTEFIYRGHVRELLERVAARLDTRPGTAAERCIAMAEAAKAIPLHGAAAGLYFRMASYAFPGHALFDPSLTAHYEKAHRQGMDRYERFLRGRLAVPGRRLNAARIECDGEHWGQAVTCMYADTGTGEGSDP